MKMNEPDVFFLSFVLVGVLVGLLVGIGIGAALCYFISSWLKEVPEDDRVMTPGQVWLLLIPFFNFYWNFRVYMYDVPQSFKNYFQRQGKERNEEVGDCGKTMGMWLCICTLSSLIPFVGSIVGMGTLVFLILWMLKIHELKNKIIADRQKTAEI